MMGETSLCRWDELHVAAAVGDAAGVQRILQKKTGKSLSHPTDHVSAQLDEIACINNVYQILVCGTAHCFAIWTHNCRRDTGKLGS